VVHRLEAAWARSRQFSVPNVDHDSLDQVHILERWLRRHDGHPSVLALSDTPDWHEIVERARSLTTEELTYEPTSRTSESAVDDSE
jgi:hypothetical protein